MLSRTGVNGIQTALTQYYSCRSRSKPCENRNRLKRNTTRFCKALSLTVRLLFLLLVSRLCICESLCGLDFSRGAPIKRLKLRDERLQIAKCIREQHSNAFSKVGSLQQSTHTQGNCSGTSHQAPKRNHASHLILEVKTPLGRHRPQIAKDVFGGIKAISRA